MFANTFQSGFITIFYSLGSNPLNIWEKYVKNGHIRRLVDEEVKSLVLEISGTNVATTFISCPPSHNSLRASLAIRLPFLVMVVKNMNKYFSFEIQILDDKDMRRRFRVSNFQSTTKVRPFCTTMPIGLSQGWNQIQFNLADFTKRAYGTLYVETQRVQVHANVRIRRIYFSDRLYAEDEMPSEYKLFLPLDKKGATQPGPSEREVKKDEPMVEVEQVPEIAERPSQIKTEVSVKEEPLSDTKIQILEQEIPSGAPPSPVEAVSSVTESPVQDALPAEEPGAGDVPDIEKEEKEAPETGAEELETPVTKTEEEPNVEAVAEDAMSATGSVAAPEVVEEVAQEPETAEPVVQEEVQIQEQEIVETDVEESPMPSPTAGGDTTEPETTDDEKIPDSPDTDVAPPPSEA